MPPKIGVNRNGVAVTLTFLSTRLPIDPHGVPVHTLLHHLLEHATSTDDAVERLLGVPAAACAAIGVLDASGHAALVEIAPRAQTSLAATTQPLLHTNHCLSTTLAGLDTPGPLLDNSCARLERARHLMDSNTEIETILADDTGPHPIALAPIGDLGTVVAIVIDVNARTLRLAPGSPARHDFDQTVGLEP